jgi:glycosyltransferase involved in cell wall biosynthesis
MVSIVIAAYRAENTVREALDSVLRQTCWVDPVSDGEIIVVDDASPDRTADVARACLEHASMPWKVLSLSQNQGPAGARNRGIEEAKGEWVAFLDGDDAWLPDKLVLQLKVASEHPEVALICGETVGMERDGGADTGERATSGEGKRQGTRCKVQGTSLAGRGEAFVGGESLNVEAVERGSGKSLVASRESLVGEERRQQVGVEGGAREVEGRKWDVGCREREVEGGKWDVGRGEGKVEGKEPGAPHPVSSIQHPASVPTSLADDCSLSPRLLLSTCTLPLTSFAIANPVATSTVLVKTQAVVDAGGFDERFRGPEDYDLWIRIAARCPVLKMGMPLTRYRETPGSLSLDDRRFLNQVLAVLEKAYGEGGVLHAWPHLKPIAVANQYRHASWMAFVRGARMAAIQLLLWGMGARWAGGWPGSRDWYDCFTRFCRYSIGPIPKGETSKCEDS